MNWTNHTPAHDRRQMVLRSVQNTPWAVENKAGPAGLAKGMLVGLLFLGLLAAFWVVTP